jgi:hypothetical protein
MDLVRFNRLLQLIYPPSGIKDRCKMFILGNFFSSLPPCGPYLATRNISPENKFNTTYIGQCFEKQPFATSGSEITPINNLIPTMTSCSDQWQSPLRNTNGLSPRTLRHLTVQIEACTGRIMQKHIVNYEDNEKWIGDIVDRETTEAIKQVEDAEPMIDQKQEDL